jgi:CBS domain-containing protein
MIDYEEIASAIQVRHLQTRLEHALSLGPTDDVASAATTLAKENFDQAPVLDDTGLLGVVTRAALERATGSVREVVEPVRPIDMVSADAPVARLMSWLLNRQWLMVLDGHETTGFVVAADLNKQPARTYFYLLVASFEAGLADVVRSWAGAVEERILEELTTAQRRRATAARTAARHEDVDADLVAYLYLSDLLRIVGRVPELRRAVGATSGRGWARRTGSLNELRHAVMHPTRDLLDRQRPLGRLIELETELHSLLATLAANGSALRSGSATIQPPDSEAAKG